MIDSIPATLPLREIDPDEPLGPRLHERSEVGALRVGVSDLEHGSRVEPRQDPGDLDDALIGRRGAAEPAELLTTGAGRQPERDCVVELPDPLELC